MSRAVFPADPCMPTLVTYEIKSGLLLSPGEVTNSFTSRRKSAIAVWRVSMLNVMVLLATALLLNAFESLNESPRARNASNVACFGHKPLPNPGCSPGVVLLRLLAWPYSVRALHYSQGYLRCQMSIINRSNADLGSDGVSCLRALVSSLRQQ